jgi:hypothetical protein
VRGTVLPCKTKNRAQHTRYWSPIKVISEGHGSDVLDEGEVVLTRLGGVDNEIECGAHFALQNHKISAMRSVSVCYGIY